MSKAERGAVRFAGYCLIVALVLVGLEVGSRLVLIGFQALTSVPSVAAALNRSVSLDSYEMPSTKHLGHWQLRPGYGAALSEVAANKLLQGRTEGAAAIGLGEGQLVINSLGFKGGELDPDHRRLRILFLGDSVTFGFPTQDYVRFFAMKMAEWGMEVETVNGGVEGYSTRNHALEMERYRALRPDMVVFLLGWNDLFAFTWRTGRVWDHLASLEFLDKVVNVARRVGSDAQTRAAQLRNKPKVYAPDSPEVRRLLAIRPKFVDSVEQLGAVFSAQGARVVVATLPGLYSLKATPDNEAMDKGHLPEFIDNPAELAALTEAVNRAFRDVTRARGWLLADLANWSDDGLQPRSAFFHDSVHLSAEGYALVGKALAGMLAPEVGTLLQQNGRRGP